MASWTSLGEASDASRASAKLGWSLPNGLVALSSMTALPSRSSSPFTVPTTRNVADTLGRRADAERVAHLEPPVAREVLVQDRLVRREPRESGRIAALEVQGEYLAERRGVHGGELDPLAAPQAPRWRT